MKWEDVKIPFLEGGLGLRPIVEMNIAFKVNGCGDTLERMGGCGRGWWRLSGVWGMQGGLGREVNRPHDISLQKKISSGNHKFLECTRWKVGKGDRIWFWGNEWIGDFKLEDHFSRIFAIAQARDIIVEEAYSVMRGSRDWTVQVNRNLNDWEVDER